MASGHVTTYPSLVAFLSRPCVLTALLLPFAALHDTTHVAPGQCIDMVTHGHRRYDQCYHSPEKMTYLGTKPPRLTLPMMWSSSSELELSMRCRLRIMSLSFGSLYDTLLAQALCHFWKRK